LGDASVLVSRPGVRRRARDRPPLPVHDRPDGGHAVHPDLAPELRTAQGGGTPGGCPVGDDQDHAAVHRLHLLELPGWSGALLGYWQSLPARPAGPDLQDRRPAHSSRIQRRQTGQAGRVGQHHRSQEAAAELEEEEPAQKELTWRTSKSRRRQSIWPSKRRCANSASRTGAASRSRSSRSRNGASWASGAGTPSSKSVRRNPDANGVGPGRRSAVPAKRSRRKPPSLPPDRAGKPKERRRTCAPTRATRHLERRSLRSRPPTAPTLARSSRRPSRSRWSRNSWKDCWKPLAWKVGSRPTWTTTSSSPT